MLQEQNNDRCCRTSDSHSGTKLNEIVLSEYTKRAIEVETIKGQTNTFYYRFMGIGKFVN